MKCRRYSNKLNTITNAQTTTNVSVVYKNLMCRAWSGNIDVEKEFYEQEINRKCFFSFGHFILKTKEHQNVILNNQWDIWLSVLGLLLEMLLLRSLTSYKRSFMIDFYVLNRFLVCNRIIHKYYKKKFYSLNKQYFIY